MESQQLQDNVLSVSHDKKKKVKLNQNSVKKDQEKKSVVHYLKLTKTAIQQLLLLSVFTINRKYWIIFF